MFNFHQLLSSPFISILLFVFSLIPYYFKAKLKYYIFSSVDILIGDIEKMTNLKKPIIIYLGYLKD